MCNLCLMDVQFCKILYPYEDYDCCSKATPPSQYAQCIVRLDLLSPVHRSSVRKESCALESFAFRVMVILLDGWVSGWVSECISTSAHALERSYTHWHMHINMKTETFMSSSSQGFETHDAFWCISMLGGVVPVGLRLLHL